MYLDDDSLKELKIKLKRMYSKNSRQPEIYLTENGRTALYLFLSSLDLPEGSEVAVQPFTCNSAINPVIWSGYKPVYVDINPVTLSMDPEQLKEIAEERNLSAVILQHTFGIPASINEIREICNEKNIMIIEDCAHALGSRYEREQVGTFGDAAVVSFGLEKYLPTKAGGALILNEENLKYQLDEVYAQYDEMGKFRTFIWLLNPLIRVFSRKIGYFRKPLISFLEKIKLFETGFSKEELSGGMPSRYPRKMSNPIAEVVLGYFETVKSIADTRIEHSNYYRNALVALGYTNNLGPIDPGQFSNGRTEEGGKSWGVTKAESQSNNPHPIEQNFPLLKFPFFTKNPDERSALASYLRSEGYYITQWYDNPIYPVGTDLQALDYVIGTCPVAETASQTVINLPTGDPFSREIAKSIEQFYQKTKT